LLRIALSTDRAAPPDD